MLVQLQIENFRSFRERQSIVTLQRNVKRLSEHVYEHRSGLKILKTTGIYGANASGKTNLFLALYYLKKWLQDENFLHTLEGNKYFTTFLLDKTYMQKSTLIEVDFIIDDEKVFVYTVEVSISNKKIIQEKLVQIEPNEILIFDRKYDNSTEKTKLFFPSDKFVAEELEKYFNDDELFLSQTLFHEENCALAYSWFTEKIEFQFPVYDFNDIAYIFTIKPEYLRLANDIVKISKVGIDQLEISKIPLNIYFGLKDSEIQRRITEQLNSADNKFYSFKDDQQNYCSAIKEADGSIYIAKLICYHMGFNGNLVPFDVDQESRGTRVLLHLIPALLRSYGEGINYFLDDINTSLHPILLKEILGQYLSYNIGSAKGQLIFNSHEDFLMDERIIRQDELWLMEKSNGASTIFPLSEFDVRFDLNYRKNYLNGKFGGVPFKSEPEKLVFGE